MRYSIASLAMIIIIALALPFNVHASESYLALAADSPPAYIGKMHVASMTQGIVTPYEMVLHDKAVVDIERYRRSTNWLLTDACLFTVLRAPMYNELMRDRRLIDADPYCDRIAEEYPQI